MNLNEYLNETEIDFNKAKHKLNSNELKDIHDDLVDITNKLRTKLEKNDKTSAILVLLVSARKELKSYIDKRE